MSFSLLPVKEQELQITYARSCELVAPLTARLPGAKGIAGARTKDAPDPTSMDPVGSRTGLLARDNKDSATSGEREPTARRPLLSAILPREIFGSAGEYLPCIALAVGTIASSFAIGWVLRGILPPFPSPPAPTCTHIRHTSCRWGNAPNLTPNPTVILISLDGFRWGYEHKVPTPNIDRLRYNGTEAAQGLIPVYPSVTFPNHYSIATGLYPPSHGIVGNSFVDPLNSTHHFSMTSHDPYWWLGEPIWETVVNQGLSAATYFWPGSEVVKGNWTCPKGLCMAYNGGVAFEKRVDKVLSWLDLPAGTRPSLLTLYMEEPDHTGHQVGPDAPQIGTAVARVDDMIGRLLDGLTQRGILEDVNIILLGDHGMLANCQSRHVVLDEYKPWIGEINGTWIRSYFPLLAIAPPPGVDAGAVVEGFRKGAASKNVTNSEYLEVFLKEDFPQRFNYSGSDRIPPILGVVAEGYSTKLHHSSTESCNCVGSHGYDNELLSMRTIFVARGPRFARGRLVPAFRNVEVYGLIASILGLSPAPNNGSSAFVESMLLPTG